MLSLWYVLRLQKHMLMIISSWDEGIRTFLSCHKAWCCCCSSHTSMQERTTSQQQQNENIWINNQDGDVHSTAEWEKEILSTLLFTQEHTTQFTVQTQTVCFVRDDKEKRFSYVVGVLCCAQRNSSRNKQKKMFMWNVVIRLEKIVKIKLEL